jgi:hypothetical protein
MQSNVPAALNEQADASAAQIASRTGGADMKRQLLLALAVLGLPRPAPAQQPSATPATPPWRGSGPPRSAADRDARHRWLEENWDALPADERRRA